MKQEGVRREGPRREDPKREDTVPSGLLDRLLTAIDVDPTQWRALVRLAWRTDLRTTSAMSLSRMRASGQEPHVLWMYVSLLMMGGFLSVPIWLHLSLLFSATLFFTFILFNLGSSLLIDFQSIVISPDDYRQLAYQPISSRTFLVARTAGVLLHVWLMTGMFAVVPLIAFLTASQGGLGAVGAAIVALLLASTTAAGAAVWLYAWLLQHTSVNALKQVLTWLQLILSTVLNGFFLLVPLLATRDLFSQITPPDTIWVSLYPPSWYAAIVEIGAGRGSAMALGAAGVAMAACALSLYGLSGRVSLDYADRLGALWTASDAGGASARLRRGWLFRDHEARAVALLIRAQFRHDLRFRLAVLGILPITVIYLLFTAFDGSISDPFTGGSHEPQLVYFAVILFPALLKQALVRSDAWRAAWIFHATPADGVRLVLALKEYVLVAFLLPYIVAVGLLLSLWFETWWHVALLVLVLALVAHLLLLLDLWIRPQLPFSQPATKGARTRDTIFLMFVISCVGVSVPRLLSMLFATPTRIVSTFVVLLLVTAALQVLAARRVRSLMRDVEAEV